MYCIISTRFYGGGSITKVLLPQIQLDELDPRRRGDGGADGTRRQARVSGKRIYSAWWPAPQALQVDCRL